MIEYTVTVKVDDKNRTATVLYLENGKVVGRVTVEPPEKGARAFKVVGSGGSCDYSYSPYLASAIRLAIKVVADDITEQWA